MAKPKHSRLPGYRSLFTSRSPLQTDRVQESFFLSTRLGPDADWHLYGNPRGTTYLHTHAAVWLWRVGCSQREADSGGWLISWTATHQLLATKMPCYYGGGLGDHKEKESEKTWRYSVPAGFLNYGCGQQSAAAALIQYNMNKSGTFQCFCGSLFFVLLHGGTVCAGGTPSHVFGDVWSFIFAWFTAANGKTHMASPEWSDGWRRLTKVQHRPSFISCFRPLAAGIQPEHQSMLPLFSTTGPFSAVAWGYFPFFWADGVRDILLWAFRTDRGDTANPAANPKQISGDSVRQVQQNLSITPELWTETQSNLTAPRTNAIAF